MTSTKPGTDLTPRTAEIIPVAHDAELPDLHLASTYVDQLVENADTEVLREFRNQAEAHRLYQERAKNLKAANHFARLKLMVESGLGALALADSPSCKPDEARCIWEWRVLAIAHERGALDAIYDRIEGTGESLTTTRVVGIARREGWTKVERSAFVAMATKRAKELGLSRPELADKAGVPRVYLYPHKNLTAMEWAYARIWAKAIGIDATHLPPYSRPKIITRKDGRARWLVVERTRRGGKWDRAYGYFRQCVDQFKDLAPNADPRWDDAYMHLRAIEDIIGREMAKERAGTK